MGTTPREPETEYAKGYRAGRGDAVADLRKAVMKLDHFPGHTMRPPNAQRWLDRYAVLRLLRGDSGGGGTSSGGAA